MSECTKEEGARAAEFASLLRGEIGRRGVECAAVACLAPLLLVIAFWNGFPIIYYDTGAYILQGLGGVFLEERSPVYSLFLWFAGAKFSLWLVAVWQALIVAFVMTQVARALAPHLRLLQFLAIAASLVVMTGLPWYVGEIEPDCLAAVVALAIYLMAFHARTLGLVRSALLFAAGSFAAGAHPSHLLLGAAVLFSLVAYRATMWTLKSGDLWPVPHLLWPALTLVVALSLVFASNFAFTRQVFFSRAGPAFFFARLVQDRIVMQLLDETCPQSGYRLCAYKSVMPPTADGWLWGRDSPFMKLGRFSGTRAESQRIIADSMTRYPWLQLRAALADAAIQFVSFKTGDQIEPQEWILYPELNRIIPAQMSAYLEARQQKSEMVFAPVNWLHVPFAWASLIGLAAALGLAIRRRKHIATLALGFVVITLVANAVICGALSNPHDRYQSRLIWLAPFTMAVILAGADCELTNLLDHIGGRTSRSSQRSLGSNIDGAGQG